MHLSKQVPLVVASALVICGLAASQTITVYKPNDIEVDIPHGDGQSVRYQKKGNVTKHCRDYDALAACVQQAGAEFEVVYTKAGVDALNAQTKKEMQDQISTLQNTIARLETNVKVLSDGKDALTKRLDDMEKRLRTLDAKGGQ